jgi:diphosphomevalonate decarboxylase
MHWFAQAPANIALIKYMGKKDKSLNLPDNPSLSYTLDNLLTNVMLEVVPGKNDIWEPLSIPGAPPFTLSQNAQARFLKHLQHIKTHFNYEGAFIVRSSNNFPLGSGLASSASSFAALTICAVRALSELQQRPLASIEQQAELSRIGSGSSCRSFFSPWVLWENDTVAAIDLPYKKLLHQVILISHEEKKISSSEAHQRVKTSPHYLTRSARATENLEQLLNALKVEDWKNCYKIAWQEFQDMHNLFETCEQPFTYKTAETHTVLQQVQAHWDQYEDGPIVTMDAGPNIHLLYRPDQKDRAQEFKSNHLVGNYDVL